MKQIVLVLLMALLVFVVACAPAEVTDVPVPIETAVDVEKPGATFELETPEEAVVDLEPVKDQGLKLTLEELKQYDGKDGRPAYVAVDGIIYDVTDSSFWKNGSHNGYSAGNDLTDAIKTKSPHGVANLERVLVIGELVD